MLAIGRELWNGWEMPLEWKETGEKEKEKGKSEFGRVWGSVLPILITKVCSCPTTGINCFDIVLKLRWGKWYY